jgi:hypothetical protein
MTVLAGCAETTPVRESEGSVAFHSGAGEASPGHTQTVPGPSVRRPGILTPAYEPVWRSAWVSKDQPGSMLQGATAGLTTSIAILQIAPLALTFWPAAVGIVAGATAMGMLGITQDDAALERLSPPDRAAIAEATQSLRPDRLWRDSMAEALAQRMGSPLPDVPWHPGWGPDTAASDPLIEARARAVDGVLDFAVDAMGLAVGEEADTFGVFIQVRARLLDARDGQLRYQRILSYGPGQPVADLPRSEFHTIEFLALDKAQPYRYLASEAIRRMARLLAEDPALPLAPR